MIRIVFKVMTSTLLPFIYMICCTFLEFSALRVLNHIKGAVHKTHFSSYLDVSCLVTEVLAVDSACLIPLSLC